MNTSAPVSTSSSTPGVHSQSGDSYPNGTTTGVVSTGPQSSSTVGAAAPTTIPSGTAQSTISSASPTLGLTTSTVLSTRIATITACPTTVPDCPATARETFVTTETIVVSTTICPVTEAATATATRTLPASALTTGVSEKSNERDGTELTTSTVYSTRTATITACPSSVTNCPLRSKTTYLTTETLVVSTTICPVSEVTATSVSATTAKQTSPAITDVPGNGASLELTTSTVYATHTATVLACPESVTDCPLRSKTLSASTQTVAIATTVYPVPVIHTTVSASSVSGSQPGSQSSHESAENANAGSNSGSGAGAAHTTTIAVESCSDDNTCTGYINTIVMTQTNTVQSTANPSPFKPHWTTGATSNHTATATAYLLGSQSSGMTTATISATTGAVSPVYTGAAPAGTQSSFMMILGTVMVLLGATLV